MLHRDLKPSNILLGRDEQTYIVDFGLALPHDERYERRGELAGTYAYMSPEQVTGQTANGRTDIWSAGVILYEMLTGMHPFTGKNRQELFDQIKNLDPIPPRQRRDDIPEELERICLRCIEKEEGRRFGTATDLGAALRKLQEKPLATARLQALRIRASAAKRWVRPWMAVAGIVIVSAFLFVIWHKSDADVAKEIEQRLRANSASLSRIKVHVNGHVAMLEGTICNASEKDNAARIAASVSGKQCVNKIEVTGTTKVNSKDGLTYVWIPPGGFQMGCSLGDRECERNEQQTHPVTITKGFWMGQTAVTQAAYRRLARENPKKFPWDQSSGGGVRWAKAKNYATSLLTHPPTAARPRRSVH